MNNKMDILNEFSNSHGWFDYSEFNNEMIQMGFSVEKLERHNRTDGEVHFRYIYKSTNESFDFNGNYWNAQSFNPIIEWAINTKK